jgi:gamma-glutamyltranspeptidase
MPGRGCAVVVPAAGASLQKKIDQIDQHTKKKTNNKSTQKITQSQPDSTFVSTLAPCLFSQPHQHTDKK